MLTAQPYGAILRVMNKKEIAQMIGITSRQQIEFVLSGKRNFSYATAQKATVVIGGTIGIWMDKKKIGERKKLWARFTKTLQKNEEVRR
jgi:plasmid maintenance system antidote protein VapI